MLFYGKARIASVEGAQQGSPEGPTAFALAFAALLKEMPPTLASSIVFKGKLLDDAAILAPPATIHGLLLFLLEHGPSVGLYLNVSKCQIIGSRTLDGWPEIARLPWAELVHLGTHCGSGPSRDAFAEDLATKAAAQIASFAVVADSDPLAGFTLLRLCAGRAALNYHFRTMGPHKAWARVEAAFIQHAGSFIGEMHLTATRAQAALPLSKGGFGISDPTVPQSSRAAHCSRYATVMFAKPLSETRK